MTHVKTLVRWWKICLLICLWFDWLCNRSLAGSLLEHVLASFLFYIIALLHKYRQNAKNLRRARNSVPFFLRKINPIYTIHIQHQSHYYTLLLLSNCLYILFCWHFEIPVFVLSLDISLLYIITMGENNRPLFYGIFVKLWSLCVCVFAHMYIGDQKYVTSPFYISPPYSSVKERVRNETFHRW